MKILKKWIAWIAALLGAMQLEVFAGQMDIPEGTDLQGNTGFPGDGSSATMLQDARSVPRTGGNISGPTGRTPNGEASYGYTFKLPPARLRPSIGVSYLSGAPKSREMVLGWAISGLSEITRAREPKFFGKDYFRLSGLFGSGLLVPAPSPANTWILKGADTAITALRSSDGSTWTIWVDGVKHVLTKVLGTGAEFWRIKSSDDDFENNITDTDDSAGKITKIEYGGTNAANAIAKIEFDYVDDALKAAYGAGPRHSAYANNYGVVEILDKRLDTVRVSANSGSGYTEVYRYKLLTAMMGNREVLEKIQQYTTNLLAPPLTRAEFSYQPFLDASQRHGERYTGDITSPHVSTYSDSLTEGIEDLTPMTTSYSGALADFNRDGLPDLIEGGRSNTFIRPDLVTPKNLSYLPTASNKWTVTLQVKDLNGPIWSKAPFTVTMPINTAPNESATSGLDTRHGEVKSLSKLIDLDGDGYLDLIRTDGVGPSANNWKVYYGINGGFGSAPTTERAPSGHIHSQVSVAVNADMSVDGAPVLAGTMSQDLADMDRDGWLDIWVVGGYYRHLGSRGAGFSATLTPYAFSPGKSMEYTVKTLPLHDYLYDQLLRKMQVDESREIKGWHDLNGDGWQDYVEAPGPNRTGTDWKVYLGGPTGVSTTPVTWAMPYAYNYIEIAIEGSPQVIYTAPNAQPVPPPPPTDPPTPPPLPGTPMLKDQEVGIIYQQIIDVDGDGLPDFLVMDPSVTAGFGGKWLQNTGGGFGSTWHDVPAWYPQGYFGGAGFGAASGESDYLQKVDSAVTRNGVIPGGPIGISIAGGGTFTGAVSLSQSTTTMKIMDLNADSVLDAFDVDVSGGGAVVYRDDTAVFGLGDRAFYLIRIREPDGTQVDLDYESDANAYPVGMLGNVIQDTPTHYTRLKRVTITDRVTNQSGYTEFRYLAGHESRGEFLGYEFKHEDTYINGVLTKREQSGYDLETEFPAALKSVWSGYDENMCTVPALSAGAGATPVIDVGAGGESTHKTMVTISGFVKKGTLDTMKLPSTIDVSEHGEVSGSKVSRKSLTWGTRGELLTAIIDGDTGSTTNTDFYKLTAADGINLAKGLILPHSIKMTDSTGRALSEEIRYYDNNTDNAVTSGFLTKKRQCLDLISAAGESGQSFADTLFTPGPRGSLAKKVAATGVTHTYGYSFGYSIPTKTTVNSVADPTTQYTTTDKLDYRLRVSESTAASGVKTFTTYDFFDRPIEESIQGRAADAPKTVLRKHSYQDVSLPNWHRIEGMGSGGTDVYQDLDGMGNVVRSWTKSGSTFVRTDSLYDVRGLKIKSAYPVSGQPSHDSSAPFAFDQVLDMHYYDGFGNERETYADYSAGVGHTYILKPTPRVAISVDGEDYQNELTVNGLGHLTQVRKGKAGSFAVAGSYTYEANGLLKSYTTPKSDVFSYVYDMVGRLRTVNKGVVGRTLTPWYIYAYDHVFPLSRTDNLGGFVSFTFDSLARLTKTRVSDPLLPHIDYGVEYDADFFNVPKKHTDALGYEEIDLTGKGEMKSRRRVWSLLGVTLLDKTIKYDYAKTGELTDVTYPSGNSQKMNYRDGLLATRVIRGIFPTLDGQNDRTLTYGYGQSFRKLTSVSAGSDYPTLEIKRTQTSTQIDKLIYDADKNDAAVEYTYLNNGMIASKNHTGDLIASGLQTNTYDTLGQLTRIAKSGVGDVFNARYHPDGSLSSYRAADGSVYSYLYPGAGTEEANAGLRKPASRINGAVTETYLYDAAGRRTSSTRNKVTTSYLYDGLGRVRRVLIDGVPRMDYCYDANGKVISELANPTTGGAPVYFLGPWRYFSQSHVEIEDYSKFLSATLIPNTLPAPAPEKVWGWIWKFSDLDGHIVSTYVGASTLSGREILSPSGETLDSAGLPWDHEAFQGKRYNANVDLLQIGARQMTAEDGTWLAPEPALYAGMARASLKSPLKYSAYRYAGNDSVNGADLSGLDPVNVYLDSHVAQFTAAMNAKPVMCSVTGELVTPGPSIQGLNRIAIQTLAKPVSEGGFGMKPGIATATVQMTTDPIVGAKLGPGSFSTGRAPTPFTVGPNSLTPPPGMPPAVPPTAAAAEAGVVRTPTLTPGAAFAAAEGSASTSGAVAKSIGGAAAGVAADASLVVSIASFDISDNSSRQAEDPSGAQIGGVIGGGVGLIGGGPGVSILLGTFGAVTGHQIENSTYEYEETKFGSEDQFKPKY